ncbi:MAG: insulinase family protein [Ignavibacteria bacterium]|nr:insulinase family protein [Ignavibacteria bacterium]
MKRILVGTSFILLFFVGSLFSQPKIKYKSLDDPIPVDPKIRMGTLPNGLKYYIRYNKKPEKRAELFLGVKVGSLCEDPDQNGLAHFVEHMAFNGTKNFPKQDLVNFLESIGIKFGPDLNAFTSWDRTVYMLQIPTDSQEQFLKGFQVLEEWAHLVSFDHEEIDKERGVVIEEYRLGRGADERVERKHYKYLFHNSKYYIHDVIGDTNVIRNASYDVIKRFYKDWYRPDLMAIAAVGDFDVDYVEKIIKERFGKIPKVPNPRPLEQYEIPEHKELFVSVASDKELSFPRVVIYFKGGKKEEGTFRAFRESFKQQLFTTMLNQRLNEYLRKPDPPFKFFVTTSIIPIGMVNTAFFMLAGAIGDKIEKTAETLFLEAFRVYQNGFTPTELERAKKEILRQYEQFYDERDKQESRIYAHEYLRNFQTGEGIPGIEFEYELAKLWLPEITLDEVNALAKKLIKNENTVVTISLPEREGIVPPKEEEILKKFNTLFASKIEPYVDVAPTKPLFTKTVKEGKIVKERKIKGLDAIEYTLDNGARVVVKKTDFKDDEIKFRAISLGGTSLITDEDYINADFSADIISESGLGDFGKTELEKYLADKVVTLSPFIGTYTEGLSGSCSPKDLQTLFEMINLYFTQPKFDLNSFLAQKQQFVSYYEDREKSPESVFFDSTNYYIWNKHYRQEPYNKNKLETLDPEKVYDIFTTRFNDPADFVFIFVGNIDYENAKKYITKFIASIPSQNSKENWKDVGLRYFTGKLEKVFRKGIEKKSFVRLAINGKFDWDLKERFLFRALVELLRIRLREVLREDKGGVYGVGVWGSPDFIFKNRYSLNIYWGTDPDRVDELTNSAIEVLKDVATRKQDAIYLTKIREIFRRELEVESKKNEFWVGLIDDYYLVGDPENKIKIQEKYIEKLNLDDILKTAKKYIKFDNFAKFILYPENY